MKPAKKLGILGDGQLGRMSALAAKKLGIETIIFGQDEKGPAAQVADHFVKGAYTDQGALQKFTSMIDVCTYEFENIPVDTLRFISQKRCIWPNIKLLETSQHRVIEKKFLNDAGIKTTKWYAAHSLTDIEKIQLKTDRSDYIVKTCRFGYDGKGQVRLEDDDKTASKIKSLNSDDLIIEEPIDFLCEISVIIARDQFGTVEIYDPPLNKHKNHILDRSIVPAPLPTPVLDEAKAIGRKLAKAFDLIGVMALELFVTKDYMLLANEIAPRTHNSGHWTMDGCEISQFENHVRAVCGLPILPPQRLYNVEMINLIGDDINHLTQYEENPNARIHLYGKAEARPGRKMGHVNILSPCTDNAAA